MNTYAFMLLALFTSCIAQAASNCNCQIYPWRPDPPCHDSCSSMVLANADVKTLVSVFGLSLESAQRIKSMDISTGSETTQGGQHQGMVGMQRSQRQVMEEGQCPRVDQGQDTLSEYQKFLPQSEFEALKVRLRSLTQKDFQLIRKSIRKEQ